MEELELGRVTVFTPDAKAISHDTFKKPFILLGEIPNGSTFLDVRSLPNVLDLMGMPSGGGPPGFSVLSIYMKVPRPPRLVLLAGFLPGAELVVRSPALWLAGHVGTCTTVGLVVNYFEFVIGEEADGAPNPDSLSEVTRFVEQNGYLPVPLIEYETPEVLLRGMAVPGPLGA